MMNDVIIKFYKADGESFTISRGGEWRFLKKGLSGFGLASGSLSYSDNVMGDGGEIKNVRLTRVDRTVKAVYMIPTANSQARQSFLKFFRIRETYKVVLSYMGVTRWAEGILYKLQMSEKLDDDLLLNATMTFAFANPLWKSMDNFGKDIAAVTETAGFPWLSPIGVGTPAGVFNFSREVILSNDGDVVSYPSIIITAKDDVLNPIIRINDAFVKINDAMTEGDTITLNLGALPPRVEKNGVNYFGHADKTSQFNKMYLDLGDNTVSFDADDGSDNLAVTVYYNKMYTVI